MSDPSDEDKIVPLWDGIAVPNEAGGSDEVISVLQYALERAKRGELTAIALVGVMPSNSVYRSWAKGLSTRATLLGAIESMKHEMIMDWFDEVQPSNFPIDVDPAS